MKLLIQRVSEASVTIDNDTVGAIEKGFMVLVCAEPGDSHEDVKFLARKTLALRIFSDDAGKMNLSIGDVGGAVLAISQFTLAARWRKGNRPGFTDAAPPKEGERLFNAYVEALRSGGIAVETGRFGAEMQVALVNDGPVTLWIDGKNPR
ncbi:MAG: D-aminoacyl-tRNA deacylase [Alphaproteobacteria bacterium]